MQEVWIKLDNLMTFSILIVDDSPKNIQLVASFLRRDDYVLSFAQDGPSAIEMAKTAVPDLILLDIMMPGMDGFEVCAQLKADEVTRDIPIICLTARTDRESVIRAFDAGAVDYLTKPFDGAELSSRVRIHLELKRAREMIARRENDLREEIGKALVREHELLEVTAKLEETNRVLLRLSLVDGLTKIANRRQFDIILDKELRRCARQKVELSLIMIDIDYFKNYNDHFGHLAGDECLRLIAAAVARNVRRPADLAARYGGEEFAVILPETSLQGAALIAEGIRNEIFELNVPHETSGDPGRVTVSAGVACLTPAHDTESTELIGKADKALYLAKNNGRNRVVVSTE